MGLKNEIFEGIAAYKALAPTQQDKYYDEMYRKARKQRTDEEAGEAAEKAEAEARRAGTATGAPTALITAPTKASTGTIGGVPTTQGPVQGVFPDLPPSYRRGGNVNVRRYAFGGPVHSDRDPDNPVDDIILAQLSTDPKSDLGPYAPRRPAPPVVDPEREARIAAERPTNRQVRPAQAPGGSMSPGGEPMPPPVDPDAAERIAAESAPNTRARQGALPEPALATVPPTGAPPVGAASAAQAPRTAGGPMSPGGEAAEPPPPPGGPVSPGGEPQPPPRPGRGPVPTMAGPPVIRPGAPPPSAEEQALTTAPPGGPMSPGGEPMPPSDAPPVSPIPGAAAAGVLAGQSTARGMPPARPSPPGGPMSPGGEPTDDLPPDPGANAGSSKIGRTISRAIGTPEQRAIQKQIWDLQGERDNLEAGWFKVTTVGERAQIRRQQAALNNRIEDLKKQQAAAGVEATAPDTQQAAVAPGQSAPAQPGQTTPDKAPPPPATAAPQQPAMQTGPPGMGPSLQQMIANRELNSRESRAGMTGPNQVPTKTAPKQNGPATAGSTGPGGGQGAQPAPPRGAASQPYTPQTAPKGSLGDQSRTAAFDPTKDLYDSRNAGRVNQDYTSRDATGAPTPLQPQDVRQTMAGIAQTMPQGPQVPGEGAASRPVYNQFVQRHNPGGKLEPGEAALVGMVGRYKVMLRQGRLKEASAMAQGIMQAASLEAAVRGRHAADLFKSGNTQEGQKVTMDALSQVPDGRSHTLNADGSVTTRDPHTNQVTGQVQLSGQQWLALAMGLSDGSMVWQALQASAAALKEPDKDAGNRALRGQLLEEQIIGARQRNARGAGGGRSGKAGPQRNAEVDAILGEFQPRVADSGGGGTRAGSPDYLSTDYVPEGNA